MTRTFRSEWLKLRRPSMLFGCTGAVVTYLAVGTVLRIATASAHPLPTSGTLSLADLAHAGEATAGFARGLDPVGLIIFLAVIAAVAGEYGQGTLRALLTRQPRRLVLLGGKLLALLSFVAVVLLVAELVCAVVATALAGARHVPLGDWFTGQGLTRAAAVYGTAVGTGAAYALFGAALAVLLRSTPLAIGVGLAWALPFERLLQPVWHPASHWLPFLLLEAFATGGTAQASYTHALLLLSLYALGLTGIAAVVFSRRDVTI